LNISFSNQLPKKTGVQILVAVKIFSSSLMPILKFKKITKMLSML